MDIGIGNWVGKWVDRLMKPSKYYAEIEGQESVGKIAKNLLLFGIILAIANFAVLIIMINLWKSNPQEYLGWIKDPVAFQNMQKIIETPTAQLLGTGAINCALGGMMAIVQLVVLFGASFLIANALGGKGMIMRQFFFQTSLLIPIFVVTLLFQQLVSVIAFIGAGIYLFYSSLVAVREVHKFENWKAAACMIFGVFGTLIAAFLLSLVGLRSV